MSFSVSRFIFHLRVSFSWLSLSADGVVESRRLDDASARRTPTRDPSSRDWQTNKLALVDETKRPVDYRDEGHGNDCFKPPLLAAGPLSFSRSPVPLRFNDVVRIPTSLSIWEGRKEDQRWTRMDLSDFSFLRGCKSFFSRSLINQHFPPTLFLISESNFLESAMIMGDIIDKFSRVIFVPRILRILVNFRLSRFELIFGKDFAISSRIL